MNYQIIREKIYNTTFKDYGEDIRFSDLPKNIQEDDIIEIHREEGRNSENESYESYTELTIIRERLETDKEFQERFLKGKRYEQEAKKKRYETYLRLKEEFEKPSN